MTITTKAPAEDQTNVRSVCDPFALWSEVYDQQSNPLLSLEESFLNGILPSVSGLDVVDVGCGTGRWIQLLARQAPRSITGIDASCEMLAQARTKVGGSATLLLGDCLSLPLASDSADLILASFVLSHVADVSRFVTELARVLRAGGTAFVTDAHPEAIRKLGWKRAFKYAGESITLETYDRALLEVISEFELCGAFQTVCILEPTFQRLQRDLLHKAGKPEAYMAAVNHPAIYVLQVRSTSRSSGRTTASYEASRARISGARLAFGPLESATAELTIANGVIEFMDSTELSRTQSGHSPDETIDLAGYLLLPGLINSHDHLEFGLFPNLGCGPYQNATEWAIDIQSREADVIAKQRRIPKDVRCLWGAIRNLLCGVTTVCHHNPTLPEFSNQEFPVRVLKNCDWAHSLALDEDAAAKFANREHDAPFIIHAGEGVDEQSANEFVELDRLQMLSDGTVLVHALALNSHSVSLLNHRGTAVVWCPTSNTFLFGTTHGTKILSRLDNVVLGSDSPLTAAGDLLDEVSFAGQKVGLAAFELYQMVFTRSARVLRLSNGEGGIRPGGVADLIAVRDTGRDPADTLAGLSSSDIELVTLGGRVHLAREPMLQRLPRDWRSGLEALEVDEEVVWLRAPVQRMFAASASAMGNEFPLGGKWVRNVGSN